MTKARRSGRVVTDQIVAKALAMVDREDRNHDIAAWFGLNQGRIKEIKDGVHGAAALVPVGRLPPSGSPGPKALDLSGSIDVILSLIKSGKINTMDDVVQRLSKALAEFYRNE